MAYSTIEFFARSHFHKCEEKTYFVAFFDAPFRLQKVRIIYKSLTPIHFAFSLKIFIYLNIIRILFSLEIKKIYIFYYISLYMYKNEKSSDTYVGTNYRTEFQSYNSPYSNKVSDKFSTSQVCQDCVFFFHFHRLFTVL